MDFLSDNAGSGTGFWQSIMQNRKPFGTCTLSSVKFHINACMRVLLLLLDAISRKKLVDGKLKTAWVLIFKVRNAVHL